jgi:ribosome-binding protein aMBF1 (putative translation factor)
MSRRDLADLMECHWSRIVDLENEQAEPTDSEVFAISRQLRFPLGQFTDHEKVAMHVRVRYTMPIFSKTWTNKK